MKYIYTLEKGVTKIKTNTRKYLVTGLATLVLIGGVAVPAFAAKPAVTPAAAPKATGSIGWVNNGNGQAYDEFNAITTSASCAISWNVTGSYNLAFNETGNPTTYTHDAALVQTGSAITGTGGGYPAGGPHIYEWVVDSGSVTGNQFTFTSHYTLGADAVVPLTTMVVTGTIAPNGVPSGTWTDNYQGGARTGEWVATSGTATGTVTGCTGKGNFTYSDASGINYVMDVKYVNVQGNKTWFAGPTTSGNFGIGVWIFIEVIDNGEPGVGHDQIYGEAVANETVAKNGVAGMVNPAGGPFTINSGNLQVH